MSHTSTCLRRIGTDGSEVSGGPQNRRPETYAATLSQLSETSLQPELYSRVQYQFLARYLSAAPVYRQQVGSQSQAQQRVRCPSDKFVHVVVHTFSNGAQTGRDDFGLENGLQQFMDVPRPEADSDQIVFVRGSLSPAWIGALGTKYKIDPEFFRRHLRYLPSRDYSDLPPLPSAATEMLTLILPSLYTRSHALALSQIGRCREKDSDVARKNQQTISGEAASGETVVRRFSTLSDRLFSVEHEISIFTRSRKNGGQIAIVLLDTGKEMNQEGGPPCFSRQDSMIPRAPVTSVLQTPVIVSRPPIVNINVAHPEVPAHQDPAPVNSVCHVASLLPFYFGMSLNAPSAQQDIFALMCEIFRLVTSSECQFLNRLHCLVQDQQLHSADGEQMDLALNTLRYIKALLDDHKQCLKQNIVFLKTRCSSNFDARVPPVPGLSTQTQQTRAADEFTSVLTDFQELLARAESLSAFSTDTVSLIITGAMLRESQKAIQRADDQRRLTVLAYLFLPLSLVCSLFGMNIKELGTGSQHIWLPFAVLVLVGCISWMLFYIHKVRHVLLLATQRLMSRYHSKLPYPGRDYPV